MRNPGNSRTGFFRALVQTPTIGGVVAVLIAFTAVSAQTPGRALNVKDFGARGDGMADDYEAMKKAAAALCATPGASLVYPPGTYKVLRYRIEDGPRANGVSDIVYDNCRDVSIVGDGARIEVTGDFYRVFDHMVARFRASYVTGVVPFDFVNSTRFVIRGFDINGNAQNTTRDPDVAEQAVGAGIRTAVSSQYTIRDIHVHHFATDGLFLGRGRRVYGSRPVGPASADRDVTLIRVVSDHNARNGMSLIQVRGASIIDSTFRDNGRTDGPYGGHAPRSGVDIEPVRRPPDVDVETGDIRFVNSRFENNLGIQFVTGGPGPMAIDRVDVENCHVSARNAEGSFIAFLAFPRVGTVKGCTFDVSSAAGAQQRRTIFLHGQPPMFPYFRELTYQSNTFNIDANAGVTSDPHGYSLNISFADNTINIHAATPDPTVLKLEGLHAFSGNKVSIDASGYAGGREKIAIRFDGTKAIRGNTYSTNLAGAGKRYRIAYPVDGTVTNETYVGNISP